MTLTLYTFAWLPEYPRGLVRDMRIRWALEEIGRPYSVETVPGDPKSASHKAMQPFCQVPVIRDGDLTLFESGAILLHLGEGTPLLPAARRAEMTQWLFAALNTVELAVAPWILMALAARFPDFVGPAPSAEVIAHARQAMVARLDVLEALMADRDWIAGDFSIAAPSRQ